MKFDLTPIKMYKVSQIIELTVLNVKLKKEHVCICSGNAIYSIPFDFKPCFYLLNKMPNLPLDKTVMQSVYYCSIFDEHKK